MRRGLPALLLVQGITVSRIVAAILIGACANRADGAFILVLYCYALSTDLIDGFLARKLRVSSEIGHVLDLVADKSLTAVSLLYAASMEVELMPLVVIGLRDLIMLGMRAVHDQRGSLLPTSRWFGAMMLTGVAAATAGLAVAKDAEFRDACVNFFWVLAALALGNIVWRIALMIRKLSRTTQEGSAANFEGRLL
jgi:CDP-diacylglycerol---glycerol-3-phosphate 3-phosphatidyltransferase